MRKRAGQDARDADVWHVYTDGTSKHERRQTFSAWAARAVQPNSRQIRQASGAFPGGSSLRVETEAILQGLRLVPPGETARLYCDLELSVIRSILDTPDGEAARWHLHEVIVHDIVRNSDAHHLAMHRAARDAETAARGGDADTDLMGSLHDALTRARASEAGEGQLRRDVQSVTGGTVPLVVCVTDVASAGLSGVTLALSVTGVPGFGRHEHGAFRQALARVVAAFAREALVHVRVPVAWQAEAAAALQAHPNVRLTGAVAAEPDAADEDA